MFTTYTSTFRKAILAGLFIGLSCTVYLSVENRIAGSIMFGLGLLTILNWGLNLFTGKVGYISKDNYLHILLILVGNFLGINGVALLIKQTRIAEKVMENAAHYAEIKLNDSYLSLFVLAIFCGMLMFTAVATYKLFPNVIGTVTVFFCVSVFIMAGFEHCIADMYYFTMGGSKFAEYILPLIVMVFGNGTGAAVLYHLTKDVNH